MALSQRLEMRQSQALVMTPQLMRAIKLLQLSSLDLAAYVEEELERNPLLERAPDGEMTGQDPEQQAAREAEAPEGVVANGTAMDGFAAESAAADGPIGDTSTDEWYNQDIETSRS